MTKYKAGDQFRDKNGPDTGHIEIQEVFEKKTGELRENYYWYKFIPKRNANRSVAPHGLLPESYIDKEMTLINPTKKH